MNHHHGKNFNKHWSNLQKSQNYLNRRFKCQGVGFHIINILYRSSVFDPPSIDFCKRDFFIFCVDIHHQDNIVNGILHIKV